MIKLFLKTHKIYFIVLFLLVIVAYIVSILIPKNTIVLTGEYIFSFDYLTHVRNILFDPKSILAQDYTNCFDCPDFYHYSRWYSLFKITYLSLSQILHLHPFIFLLLSMIITQLTTLYFFVRTFFKRYSWIAFFVSAFVFILYPYKYSLLVETYDGFMYSNVLLYCTLLVWTLRNIYLFSLKKAILIGLLLGVIFSFFFNISVAYFPIVFYITPILALIYRKNLLKNIQNTLILTSAAAIAIVGMNAPFFSSILTTNASRHYIGYLSYNFLDSFLAGLGLAQAAPFVVWGFAVLFILCFLYAPFSLGKKLLFLLVYFLIAILTLGAYSPIDVYRFFFRVLPFMDSLQATHRLFLLESIIFFILMYASLVKLLEKGIKEKILCIIVSALFIFLPVYHIFTHANYFFIAKLPEEYFLAQKYINLHSGEKMYFPPTTKLFHNITTDYMWSNNTHFTASTILYKNPFTSLLPITNLVEFERFPYALSPHFLELRYLTDLQNSPKDIVKAMELRGISYVILDDNYKWNDNYPNFDRKAFTSLLTIDKQFGNISIYRVKNLSAQCKSAYGTISLEYCTTLKNPSTFINKTHEEYLLEVYPQRIGTKLQIRHDSVYIKNILDPIIHQALVNSKVLFGRDVMQISGNQQNVFYSQPLKSGRYALYIPLLTYIDTNKLMGQAKIRVLVNGKTVEEFSPYAFTTGVVWKKVIFTAKQNDRVTVDIIKDGYVILTAVPLMQAL